MLTKVRLEFKDTFLNGVVIAHKDGHKMKIALINRICIIIRAGLQVVQ